MMASFTIKVNQKTGMTYFPKGIRKDGFVGEIEGMLNALTFTLVRPGTKLANVEKSLQIVLRDIRLRIEQGQEWKMSSKGQISVAEAGRLGGNTTRDRHGSEFYRKIGKRGGETTKKRYSQTFMTIGQRGGRPSRPKLTENPD